MKQFALIILVLAIATTAYAGGAAGSPCSSDPNNRTMIISYVVNEGETVFISDVNFLDPDGRIPPTSIWSIAFSGVPTGVVVSPMVTFMPTDGSIDPNKKSPCDNQPVVANQSTGAYRLLQWTPAYGQAGTYNILVNASDGIDTYYGQILITVAKVNRKPIPAASVKP